MSEIKEIKETETEWEEVKEGDLFEFEKPGDFIEGKLIHMEKDVGQHKSKMYHIKQEDGTIKKIWGSKLLDDRLLGISFGTKVKITYEGTIKPEKGREYKDFRVLKQKQP